jgi:uncharacterized spore protein YtfJ
MVGEHRLVVEPAAQAHERSAEILEELISVASADSVFSEPVVAGDRTIITAAEIRTGMGFGYGLATGVTARAGRMARSDADAGAKSSDERESEDGRGGPRGGGGGGGHALGRPVAVITIDPDGVTVQPVLDRTRIALTALAAAAAMGSMLIRMRRAGRR